MGTLGMNLRGDRVFQQKSLGSGQKKKQDASRGNAPFLEGKSSYLQAARHAVGPLKRDAPQNA
jgi:hypothetical protein